MTAVQAQLRAARRTLKRHQAKPPTITETRFHLLDGSTVVRTFVTEVPTGAATASAMSDAKPPQAQPKAPQPEALPSVGYTRLDGHPVVIVSLCGRLGRGHWMALDAGDWSRVSVSHGVRWGPPGG